MNLHRLSACLGLFVLALLWLPEPGAAQGLNRGGAISIEIRHANGYMGLGGGGLLPAIVKRGVRKPVATVRQRPRVVRVSNFDRHPTPVSLVAASLDHTGLNVSSIGHMP